MVMAASCMMFYAAAAIVDNAAVGIVDNGGGGIMNDAGGDVMLYAAGCIMSDAGAGIVDNGGGGVVFYAGVGITRYAGGRSALYAVAGIGHCAAASVSLGDRLRDAGRACCRALVVKFVYPGARELQCAAGAGLVRALGVLPRCSVSGKRVLILFPVLHAKPRCMQNA